MMVGYLKKRVSKITDEESPPKNGIENDDE